MSSAASSSVTALSKSSLARARLPSNACLSLCGNRPGTDSTRAWARSAAASAAAGSPSSARARRQTQIGRELLPGSRGHLSRSLKCLCGATRVTDIQQGEPEIVLQVGPHDIGFRVLFERAKSEPLLPLWSDPGTSPRAQARSAPGASRPACRKRPSSERSRGVVPPLEEDIGLDRSCTPWKRPRASLVSLSRRAPGLVSGSPHPSSKKPSPKSATTLSGSICRRRSKE